VTRQVWRSLWAFGVGVVLLSSCVGPLSPAPPKAYRIGWLTVGTQVEPTQIAAFRAALRDLGYVEGRNYNLEFRAAEGHAERLPALAAELVALKCDVILARDPSGVLALKQATTSIPIVIAGGSTDPVGDGLVASLARPGGNVTGAMSGRPGINSRRLQLLKEAVPAASRVAYLVDASSPQSVEQYQEAQGAAATLAIELVPLEVRSPEDLAGAFTTAGRAHPDAIFVGGFGIIVSQLPKIVDFLVTSRLPAMTQSTRVYVDYGALMYYGADLVDLTRTAAGYVDRILKGASPADLPIEQPTKYELIINMKTAKALGLTIPPSVLAQATELIQ
jgi:putative ABC transport system substrate-binding protein